MRTLFTLIVSSILLMGISNCTSSDRNDRDGNLHPKKVTLVAALIKRGNELFAQNCTACHQENGAGKAGFAPRLNSPDFLGLASDQFIKKTILEGRAGTSMMAYSLMPSVAKEADAIVAYIRSWQNDYATFIDYKVDWTKKISGNVKDGKKNFRTYCASCHGPNGGGYADGGSGPGIGLKGFLSAASDDFIKKTIEIGRAGTAMKPFGHGRGLANISESDIHSVVAYLRSLEK